MIDRAFPLLRFRCQLKYTTPSGLAAGVVYHVAAIAADIAMEDAEAILREDRRRRVARVTHRSAVQC